jgi:UDP:flavonoid glycosyltransferase YjiC (YdhE family)
VCQAGAGAMLRAARVTPAQIRQAVQATLHDPNYLRHAQWLASSQAGSNIRAPLLSLLRQVALSR